MRFLALLCLGLTACASNPGPQRPHRTGLWAEIAGGAGRVRMSCSGPTCPAPENAGGGAGLTRIGGTLSDRVLLGGESALFTHETFGFDPGDSTAQAQMELVGLAVPWFPWRSGVFLKGGVGVAQGRFTLANGTARPDSTEGTGVGMTFGLGVDVPISRKFAVTANIASFVTAIGDIVLPSNGMLPSRRVDDVIGSMLQVSVGLTFR